MANEEKVFRLRPRRPIGQRRDEIRIWSTAFQRLFHLVRMSGRRGQATRPSRSYSQRCAVRVSYSTNRAPGQWRAHGRYIARESARTAEGGSSKGFGATGEVLNLAKTLDEWQANGDERMFKIIISPEFGERMDLEAHTRTFMARIEGDLGTSMEWVAVTHYNTSHPHVHIALRGVDERGQALRFERDYIRIVMRRHAEDACTTQLGFRTELDSQEAQRREVDQSRYTSLDAFINRSNEEGEDSSDSQGLYFNITLDPNDPALHGFAKIQRFHVASRMLTLEKMGLAESAGFGTWRVRREFGDVLRAMQRATDRQKTLAAHGALLSDPRLQLQVTPLTSVTELEGRVLGHAQEDTTGRAYALIEGTDAKVHFIYHDDAIEAARHQGLMRVNSFVRLRRSFATGRIKLMVDDLGGAERILDDKAHLRNRAGRLSKTAALIDETQCWGGWLGRYQERIRAELGKLEKTARS